MHGAVTTDLGLAAGRIIAGSRSYDLSGLTLRAGVPAWTRYFWFSWVESSPAVAGPQIYIGSSDACSVYSFDARTGAKRWQSRVPGWSWPRPAIGNRAIYAGVIGTTEAYVGVRKGGLAALDRRTGRLKWIFSSSPPAESGSWYGFAASPLARRGMVFAADLRGDVYAFSDR
jgi:outer membrane protein assembly factor BamB